MFLQQFKRSKVEGPFVPIVVSLAHGDFEHNDTESNRWRFRKLGWPAEFGYIPSSLCK